MIKHLLVFLVSMCLFLTDASALPIHETPNDIILITLDGVRWQELFDGQSPEDRLIDSRKQFPNLYHWFVDNGMTFGKTSEVRVGGPVHVSMPGYLEIMRGYPSVDCLDNNCPPNKKPTLVNKFETSAVFASWNMINYIVDDSPVVNTGRDYRNAAWVKTNLPDNKRFKMVCGDEAYRPDILTGKAALDYYNTYHPQFMWISFGDTDEYAHAGDYPNYIKSLKWMDQFIGNLMKTLPEGTTVIVSPDHGRSNDWRSHYWDDESGRVWIMMSGNKIPHLGFVKADQPLYLSNIYPTVISIKENTERSLLNKL